MTICFIVGVSIDVVSVVERVPIKMIIKAATIARKARAILGNEFMSIR